jgi:hypothetical protein
MQVKTDFWISHISGPANSMCLKYKKIYNNQETFVYDVD